MATSEVYSGEVVSGHTGWQDVSSGGTAVSTVVTGGRQDSSGKDNRQDVSSGGTAIGTTAGGEGWQTVRGATLSTVVSFGGTQIADSNSVVFSTRIFEGGLQEVLFGGTASGTEVRRGRQEVFSGGFATDTVVFVGGSQIVFAGGSVMDTVLRVDGTQILHGGALVLHPIVSSGGSQIVSSGGTVIDAVVSGGSHTIRVGGLASGTTAAGVENWGMVCGMVYVYGSALDMVLSEGGEQKIYSGGIDSKTTILGGWQDIARGGIAVGTKIRSGVQEVKAGAIASSTVLLGGQQHKVYPDL